MPRIRDLGINVIPATTRPYENGVYACAAGTREDERRPGCGGASAAGSAGCSDVTCEGEVSPPSPPNCGGASGAGSAGCSDVTCEPRPGPKKESEGGLSALAIAQLRQQLEQHIATTLHI